MRNEGGSFQTLLTAPYTMVNEELATFYGFGRADRHRVLQVRAATDLTTPDSSPKARFSPPGRGHTRVLPFIAACFVRGGLLCHGVPPVARHDDRAARPPTPTPRLESVSPSTARTPHAEPCHRLFDPLGLPFEHFDGTGRFREEENGRTIDASGELVETDVDGVVDGVPELAARLASSEEVHGCFARQWFRYSSGRGESEALDRCSLEQLEASFSPSSDRIEDLILALTQTDAFLYRYATEGAP